MRSFLPSLLATGGGSPRAAIGGLLAGLTDIVLLGVSGLATQSPIDAAEVVPLASSTPPPAIGARTAYDPVSECLLVFDATLDGTVWTLPLAAPPAWPSIVPIGPTPEPRSGTALAYDPDQQRILLFGGISTSRTRLNDVWALSLSEPLAWRPLSPTGTAPEARHAASAVYDAGNQRLIVLGGSPAVDSAVRFDDVWALSLGTAPAWQRLTPNGPAPSLQAGQEAAYDAERQRMMVYAYRPAATVGELWALSLRDRLDWTSLPLGPPTPSPSGRGPIGPAAYDARDSRLLFLELGSYPQVQVLSLADPPRGTGSLAQIRIRGRSPRAVGAWFSTSTSGWLCSVVAKIWHRHRPEPGWS